LYIENFLEELPNAISIVKWPFWDLHWYYVAKKAKSLAPILLSGDGGDEMFGGYTFRYEKFLSLLKPDSSPREKTRIYLDCHERDWVPDQSDVFGQKARFSWNGVEELLEPYFDNQLDPLAQVFLADYNGKLLYNMSPIYGMFHEYFDVKYLAPLLDKNTITFAAKIPTEMKFDSQTKTGKIILRKILEKYNMESLIIKKKQGFSIDTINYWKSFGKKLCQHFLADSRSARDGLISSDWIAKYLDSQDLNVRYVNKFLGLLAVEIWYRLFVTKEMKPSEKLVV
jgi:asparagine synthase (glutamine-hydrolysing)